MSKLLAVSDLHVGFAENRQIVEKLRPDSDGDWLVVAGDVAENFHDVEWALSLLKSRFHTVVWTPGNHELWTLKDDPVQLRGEHRYLRLVEMCGRIGVLTPEDPYPVWDGEGGPVAVVPLFTLYDYSFTPPGLTTSQALELAHETGVVCTDEYFLHPDPYPTRQDWCKQRLARTEARLDALEPGLLTVLVSHYPLVREPTDILRYPQFALWCGTEGTAGWHRRYNARAVVYGHLHIPRTTYYDGVRFEEVSLGYPREWRRHGGAASPLKTVLP